MAVTKITTKTTNTPKPVTKDTSFSGQIVQAGTSAISEAQKARDVIIKARLNEQIGEQNNMSTDVNNNYVKTKDAINLNTYDAQETQKSNGVQRGIQYSQQQSALEAGISRAGMKMVIDAGKDRDGALLNIKNKIASLKSGASAELQASQSQASSEKSQLVMQEATKKQAWAREDAVQARAFANQLKLEGISQANRMAMAKFDKQTQLALMSAKNSHDNKALADSIAKQQMLDKNAKRLDILKNSPGFNMYPKVGTPNYKKEVGMLTSYYALQGFSPSEIKSIIARTAGTPLSGAGSMSGSKSGNFQWQRPLTVEQIINRN
jgi:hypothetical protein